ncbi:MAG: FecR family protein [Candidatus Omnitrophota bacterium]
MEKYFTGIFIARVFLCLVLCSSLIFSGAKAQQLEKVELTNISGDAEVLFEGADEYTAAQEGMVLESGDKIKTFSSSSAELSFNENNTNLVRLNENTSVQISSSGDEKLAMTEGEVFSSISELSGGSAFEIRTPTAVSGARGTDWVTKVTEEGTDVEALESEPYVRHFETDGTLSKQITPVNPGQMTTVRKFQRPTPPRPLADARRQQLQQVKQQVRRNAEEAVIKRKERPPFDRQGFINKIKEGRGPGKPSSSLSPLGRQDKSGVFVSREGERYPPQPRLSEQGQMPRPGDQHPLSKEKNKAIAPKAQERERAVGQAQANKVGLGKQVKPVPKNTAGPKGPKGPGGKR